MRGEHHQVRRHTGSGGGVKPGNRQNGLRGPHFAGETLKSAFFCIFTKKSSISPNDLKNRKLRIKIL
jgi:hypothetical protein